MTKECFQAIKSLRTNEEILITKPDKGAGVVILNKNDYNDKMKTILNDTTKFLDLGPVTNKDNTAKIESRIQRRLLQLRKEYLISKQVYEAMLCSKSKLDQELGKIHLILLENGYPERIINSAFKRKLQQLNSKPVHTVKKCPVYLHIPWIGNVSMKFEKQITSAVKRCFFSVKPRVIFNTRQLLPAIKKDVLLSHHHINVIYQFLCHCDNR